MCGDFEWIESAASSGDGSCSVGDFAEECVAGKPHTTFFRMSFRGLDSSGSGLSRDLNSDFFSGSGFGLFRGHKKGSELGKQGH